MQDTFEQLEAFMAAGQVRQLLVDELMESRRAVKAAKAAGDPNEMKTTRAAAHAAKVALGERGPVCVSSRMGQHERSTSRLAPG